MLSKSKDYKKAVNFTVGSLLMALISTVAFASQGLVQDRRVSLADAQSLAEKTQHNSDFPVVVNDLVLKQLNRYIGTPEGRDFMRNSLQRMANYRSMIESKLNEYQVPNEILAVPIVESGYQNLEESNKKGWGAGIWMFITRTARVFGLRVDDKVDDRLDATLLTDAAMRYLKSERLRFNSWHLALLSYNMGGEAVQKAIDKTGSRDAWTLVRNGFENDKDYLPKVMAAIIIMNNPNTVE